MSTENLHAKILALGHEFQINNIGYLSAGSGDLCGPDRIREFSENLDKLSSSPLVRNLLIAMADVPNIHQFAIEAIQKAGMTLKAKGGKLLVLDPQPTVGYEVERLGIEEINIIKTPEGKTI